MALLLLKKIPTSDSKIIFIIFNFTTLTLAFFKYIHFRIDVFSHFNSSQNIPDHIRFLTGKTLTNVKKSFVF